VCQSVHESRCALTERFVWVFSCRVSVVCPCMWSLFLCTQIPKKMTEFRDFIKLTLVKRVEERPHAEMLVGHPFVIANQAEDIMTKFVAQVAAAGNAST